MIHAGMASMPDREAALRDAVESLLPQVDLLSVYLNGYAHAPGFLRHERIDVFRSQSAGGDLSDAGKFFAVGAGADYFFATDDDMIYAPTHVRDLVEAARRYDDRCVVGLHGVVLQPQPIRSYYRDRRVFHKRQRLETDQAVHLVATSSCCIPKKLLPGLSIKDFPAPHMADIWLAVACQKAEAGMIALAHDQDYIRQNPRCDLQKTIFARLVGRDGYQTKVINDQAPWRIYGEARPGPILMRQSEVPA